MTPINLFRAGCAALAVVGLVVGCAAGPDDDPYRAWRDHDPDPWSVTDGQAPRNTRHPRNARNTRNISQTDHVTTPRDGLTARGRGGSPDTTGLGPDADAGVERYVRVALAQNPAIRAAERRVERLGARVPQATALDDPMLQVAPFGEMAQTAAGQVGVMAGVSQKLPLPGKLETRGRIAEQDVAMALADLYQTRLRIVADTRQAYWSYYFATRALETTRRSRELLDGFRQIAEAQYRAGSRSQPDVLRASTELSGVDSELITLRQRRATARGMLNRLMNRPVTAPLPEPGEVEPEQVRAGVDALLAQAAQHNPAIARAHERIEQYRHKQRLARLNRWPDLTVSVNYNAVDDEGLAPSANGDDQWWFGFGVNLPIWTRKYEAAEREARQGRLEAAAELAAEHHRVAFEVHEAWLQVEAQQELVALFRETVVPQAQQAVDASRSGYRAGTVDFPALMDNWRKLLEFELMEHRAVAQMQQAVAELERAVGGRIPSVEADAPAPAPDQDVKGQS